MIIKQYVIATSVVLMVVELFTWLSIRMTIKKKLAKRSSKVL